MPDAIAAASPPDEPPAVRVTSCGLAVAPNSGLTESHHIANSETFVLPSRIAPAAAHPRDRRAVRVADVVGQQLRAVRRAHARHRQRVLGGERDAVQRADLVAARERRVGRDRLLARLIQPRQHERVDRRVALGDPRRVCVDQLDRRDLALAHRARHPRRGALGEVGQVRNPASRRRASSES